MKIQSVYLIWVLVFCCQAQIQQEKLVDEPRVINVNPTGSDGSYNFKVTLSTPDLGCEQYADWWELVSTSGELLYRRILSHSHLDEQPFTRSGGPVDISSADEVWVRVHMNNTGYSTNAMFGSIKKGFEISSFPEDFALGLEQSAPLPSGCRF